MKIFKATLRVPTAEQYAFCEIELEDTAENIADAYYELTRTFKPKEGLSDKDFNEFLENQALGNDKNHIETYNLMSEEQKKQVQCNKRLFARLKAKTDKQNV